jgi:hypothetical protein
MIINQTWFRLFAVFWIAIVASQYYFLYRKVEALNVCYAQTDKTIALLAQMDKTVKK